MHRRSPLNCHRSHQSVAGSAKKSPPKAALSSKVKVMKDIKELTPMHYCSKEAAAVLLVRSQWPDL